MAAPISIEVTDDYFGGIEGIKSILNDYYENELEELDTEEQEKARIFNDIERLSGNQKELLKALVKSPTSQPRSHSFLSKTGLKSGSVNQVLERLKTMDIVYQAKNGVYHLTDPVLFSFLLTFGGVPHTVDTK